MQTDDSHLLRLRLAFRRRPAEPMRTVQALDPLVLVTIRWGKWTPRHTRMEVDLMGPSDRLEGYVTLMQERGVVVRRVKVIGGRRAHARQPEPALG